MLCSLLANNLTNIGGKVMNTMVLIKIGNGTFEQWKKGFDDLVEIREKFSRNAMVGKVDDHTAIVLVDVFDPKGMMEMFASDEAIKIAKELGVERTPYKILPMG